MTRFATLPLCIVLAALAGCARTDVDKVRSALLPENSTFTIGQAFDTRKVCASVAWTATNDDRGRHLVEYRCAVKGVDAWVSANASSARALVRDNAQREKDRYLDDIKALQAQVADAKNAAPQPGSISGQPMDPQSVAISAMLDTLQTGDIDTVLARDYGPRYATFERAIDEYKTYRNAPQVAVRLSRRCCVVSIDPTDAAYKRFLVAKGAAIQAMRADLADLHQQALVETQQDRIYRAQSLQANQQKLDVLAAKQQATLADIDKRMNSRLDTLANNPVTGVDEVFRWTIDDRSYPQLIYAGVQTRYRNASVEDHEYLPQEKEVAIAAIIRNDQAAYQEFRQEPQPVPLMVAAAMPIPFPPSMPHQIPIRFDHRTMRWNAQPQPSEPAYPGLRNPGDPAQRPMP